MIRNGFGGGYASFFCLGCGDKIVIRDGVEKQLSKGTLKKEDGLF
jgi:hypothetical protein